MIINIFWKFTFIVCLSMSVFLPPLLSFNFSVSIFPPVYLFIYVSKSVSLFISIFMSVFLFLHASLFHSLYHSLYFSLYFDFYCLDLNCESRTVHLDLNSLLVIRIRLFNWRKRLNRLKKAARFVQLGFS